MRRPVLALVILLISSVSLPAGVVGSPQPVPVCGVCGGGLDYVADPTGPPDDLAVDRSVAIVRIHDDGSATWLVTNRLVNDSTAAYLRSNPAVLDRLVRRGIGFSTVEGPPRNVSATIDGATMTVRFEDPDAASRTLGVLVVGYFHTGGHDPYPIITADRLTILGPEGTTITRGPRDEGPVAHAPVRIEGPNATLYGDSSVPMGADPPVHGNPYLVFAEEGSGIGVRTSLAVAVASAPFVLGVTARTFLPPLLLLALSLLAVAGVGRRALTSRWLRDPQAVAAGIVGLGVVATVPKALGAVVPHLARYRWTAGLGVLYLAVGGFARWRGPDVRLRDVMVAGLVATGGVAVALAITLSSGYVTRSEALLLGAQEAIRLLPVLLMAVFGAAVASGNRRRGIGAALVVLAAFFVAELSVAWPTQRPWGLVLFLFGLGAVGVALLGSPLFLLGGMTYRGDSSGNGRPPGNSDADGE